MFRLCIRHLDKQSQQVNSQCCSALLTTARKTTIFPQLGASPHSGHALHWISKTHGCNIEKQTNWFRTSHGSKTKRLMKVQQNSLCVWWSPVGDRGWASQRRWITETGAGVVAMLTCKPGDIWHVEQPKCGNVKECHGMSLTTAFIRLWEPNNKHQNINQSIQRKNATTVGWPRAAGRKLGVCSRNDSFWLLPWNHPQKEVWSESNNGRKCLSPIRLKKDAQRIILLW